MNEPPPPSRPPRGADEIFVGSLLMAFGLLLAVLSGGCSLTVLTSSRGRVEPGSLVLVLFFGLPFFLGGLACAFAGWKVGFSPRR